MKKVINLSFFAVCIIAQSAIGQTLDIQGHRGCRGLMPENSIPGFLKAIDLGVTTLEMDVVISADGKVVVSHDPYISSQCCVNELGIKINKKDEKSINIYMLDYEDIKLFNCGVLDDKNFPEQMKLSVYKPLLSEVLKKCEGYIRSNNKQSVQYNIELKSRPSWDRLYHPEPSLFIRLVQNVLEKNISLDRICIQSFDMRILQFWKMKYPDYQLSFLVSNSKAAAKNIKELGFAPDVYSPNYKNINQKDLAVLQGKNIKVIPWTVNEIKAMKKMIDMGVDGLITDYPNRYFDNFSSNQ